MNELLWGPKSLGRSSVHSANRRADKPYVLAIYRVELFRDVSAALDNTAFDQGVRCCFENSAKAVDARESLYLVTSTLINIIRAEF